MVMLPWVYGFTWTLGNIIFVGTFLLVLGIVVTTVVKAARRALHELSTKRTDELLWQAHFHDLPAPAKVCRHELTGDIRHRTCDNGFDCRSCRTHPVLEAYRTGTATPLSSDVLGFTMPADRYYHRGHTWVKPEEDGTVTIGLDDFGRRLVGTPDVMEFPDVGSHLVVNGLGWIMKKAGSTMRVLSPVEGEVVGVGSADDEWQLRMKPATPVTEMKHLLQGFELRPWINREMERLQQSLALSGVGLTLADGGLPVEDIPASDPNADWDYVWGEIFLEG